MIKKKKIVTHVKVSDMSIWDSDSYHVNMDEAFHVLPTILTTNVYVYNRLFQLFKRYLAVLLFKSSSKSCW